MTYHEHRGRRADHNTNATGQEVKGKLARSINAPADKPRASDDELIDRINGHLQLGQIDQKTADELIAMVKRRSA